MASQRRTTLTLPRSIRDQIGAPSPSPSRSKPNSGRTPPAPRNRKDQRKHERLQKKAHRRHVQPSQHRVARRNVPRADSESESDGQDDLGQGSGSLEVEPSRAVGRGAGAVARESGRASAGAGRELDVPRGEDLGGRSADGVEPLRLSKRALEDDAEIAALEAKLGIRGKKKLPKAFQDDGLDLLLDGLDGSFVEERGAGGDGKSADDKLWLQRKRRKVEALSEDLEDEDEDEEMLFSEGDEEPGSEFDSLSDGEGDSYDRDTDGNVGDTFNAKDASASVKHGTKVRENPYVAPTVSQPGASKKYVPPSLRVPTSVDTEDTLRLKRQIVGLLNRLSDANVVSLLGDLEKLYQNHPRQLVTQTLTERLVDLISDRSTLNDTFIILHAGLIAAVYKIIGTDFGAQFIEQLVMRLDQLLGDPHETLEDLKSPVNLISLLDRLYVFQVISCTLIFDYIRIFLKSLSETNTELLLRIIKDVGPQLRHDDPSSLKDIVVMLQRSVTTAGEANLSVRTKFMIETINDLKNNRMRTGVAAHAVVNEHTNQMKKTLGSLNMRTIRASEPLRISLGDIQETEKKGKWWLIGASWKGDDTHDNTQRLNSNNGDIEKEPLYDDEETADLLQIAREQRMNTDVRRAVFLSIMSASDCKDAHLRLTKLRLKKSQEVEVPRVLLHCARAENQYNPYYTLIAKKLCTQHKIKMAFRFALWDLFKQMGEHGEFGESARVDDEDGEDGLSYANLVNLAKLYGTLISEGLINLDALKAVDLLYLQPKTKIFVEVMLVTVFLKNKGMKEHGRSLEKIFQGTKHVEGLAKGLQYFLRKVVSKTDLISRTSERETVRSGVQKAVDALADSPEASDII